MSDIHSDGWKLKASRGRATRLDMRATPGLFDFINSYLNV